MTTRFANRVDAGRLLGDRLAARSFDDPLVVGLARGGVPVAAEAARALSARLDVVVVRKLGVPHRPEYAFGALGEDGVRVVNDRLVAQLGLSAAAIEEVEDVERAELVRRLLLYRDDRMLVDLRGHFAIVVDDGLATGASAEAAVRAVRARGATRVILAIPVAPPETLAVLARLADEVVCLLVPPNFRTVGEWYDEFDQTSDEQVVALLAGDAQPRDLRRQRGSQMTKGISRWARRRYPA